MSGMLIANIAMALAVLAISHNQATENALEFYQSTLITMYHAAIAGGIAMLGLVLRRLALVFLILSSIALVALPVSCEASVSGYQGGDDGGAFGWIFYVGCASLLASAVGTGTAIGGIYRSLRKPKGPEDLPS